MSRAQLLRSAEALGYHRICGECEGAGIIRVTQNDLDLDCITCPACNGIGRVKPEVVEQKVD